MDIAASGHGATDTTANSFDRPAAALSQATATCRGQGSSYLFPFHLYALLDNRHPLARRHGEH